MPRLFVYGTLRTPVGGPAEDTAYHDQIAASITSATRGVLANAELFDFGAYPGIAPGAGTVQGEVFEIDDAVLARADEIEGHPDFYERRLETIDVDGSPIEAWVYWAPASLLSNRPVIDSGDWFDRVRGPKAAPPLELPDDVDLTSVIEQIRSAEFSWFASCTSDGRAHSVPMWHVEHGNRIYLATPTSSVKVRNIKTNPGVVVTLPDPMDVVIVDGWATQAPDSLATVAPIFEKKYGWDPSPDAQALIEVTPLVIRAWSGDARAPKRWSL